MKIRSMRTQYACALAIALWAATAAGAASPVAQGQSLSLARAIELAATHGPSAAALTLATVALATTRPSCRVILWSPISSDDAANISSQLPLARVCRSRPERPVLYPIRHHEKRAECSTPLAGSTGVVTRY